MALRGPRRVAAAVAALCALLPTAPGVLSPPPTAAAKTGKVIQLDMYRAMFSDDLTKPIADDDLGSLLGVLAYIHKEVVPEHSQEHSRRPGRKNRIDAIARRRFHVRNLFEVIDQSKSGKSGGTLSSKVDFGRFMTFVNGTATSPSDIRDIAEYGDVIGCQRWKDPAFTVSDDFPYYWFSASGACPNINRKEKGTLTLPNRRCTRYRGPGLFQGEFVKGGLCPGNNGLPTGTRGCTYTYTGGIEDVVWLDEWVGITQEDCHSRGAMRKCRDWADFRMHCANRAYRRRFRRWANEGSDSIRSKYCVEYDIIPACDADCNSPECLAIPEEDRELGLPFWRGRCTAQANEDRAELLAQAFGIQGSTDDHQLVDATVRLSAQTCKTGLESFRLCNPELEYGGQYCSRRWGGVCEPCYIPNTIISREIGPAPFCPYDILHIPDYSPMSSYAPVCRTARPRDLCCLYADTCVPNEKDPATVPLDEDGFILVASLQSTDKMLQFLSRIARETLNATLNMASPVEKFAYSQWAHQPSKFNNFSLVSTKLDTPPRASPYLIYFTTTTTTTTTPTTITSSTLTSTTTTTMTSNASIVIVPEGAVRTVGDIPVWAMGLIAVAVASILTLAGTVAYCVPCTAGAASKKPKVEPKGRSRAPADASAAPSRHPGSARPTLQPMSKASAAVAPMVMPAAAAAAPAPRAPSRQSRIPAAGAAPPRAGGTGRSMGGTSAAPRPARSSAPRSFGGAPAASRGGLQPVVQTFVPPVLTMSTPVPTSTPATGPAAATAAPAAGQADAGSPLAGGSAGAAPRAPLPVAVIL